MGKIGKYILGFMLCLIGLAVAFNGKVTVGNNGGPVHTDKLLQHLMGGGIFLVGILFVIAARKTRKSQTGFALPPSGGHEQSRADADREIFRKMAEDSLRQRDNLEREAEQRGIWPDR